MRARRRRFERRKYAPLVNPVLPAAFALGPKPETPTRPLHPMSRDDLAKGATGWWETAFALRPTASEVAGHKCGEHQMITIVAYDIAEPKRLVRVAKICEDYGVRVQYSVFECRLEADSFADFWLELEETIDPATDRVTAYKVCAQCAKSIYSAGTQTHIDDAVAYVF